MNAVQAPPHQGLYEWLQSLVPMFLIVLVLLTFVGRTIGVQHDSMNPTLFDGDRMIVRSIFYTPARGDIIIFSKQYFQDGAAVVKRVIALAGDTVDINTQTGVVYVRHAGQQYAFTPLYEPFTSGPTHIAGDMVYPFTVPEGHVFVIGDNRGNSTDSRHTCIGAVDEREIIGQVVAVFLPFNRAQFFLFD